MKFLLILIFVYYGQGVHTQKVAEYPTFLDCNHAAVVAKATDVGRYIKAEAICVPVSN